MVLASFLFVLGTAFFPVLWRLVVKHERARPSKVLLAVVLLLIGNFVISYSLSENLLAWFVTLVGAAWVPLGARRNEDPFTGALIGAALLVFFVFTRHLLFNPPYRSTPPNDPAGAAAACEQFMADRFAVGPFKSTFIRSLEGTNFIPPDTFVLSYRDDVNRIQYNCRVRHHTDAGNRIAEWELVSLAPKP